MLREKREHFRLRQTGKCDMYYDFFFFNVNLIVPYEESFVSS